LGHGGHAALGELLLCSQRAGRGFLSATEIQRSKRQSQLRLRQALTILGSLEQRGGLSGALQSLSGTSQPAKGISLDAQGVALAAAATGLARGLGRSLGATECFLMPCEFVERLRLRAEGIALAKAVTDGRV
jgi:hypothetical protein